MSKDRRQRLHSNFTNTKPILSFIACALVALPAPLWAAQERTVGLIKRDPRAFEGYTLYKPLGGVNIYLINNAGNPVHTWTIPSKFPPSTPNQEGIRPGGEVFLRKNGELVLTADWGLVALKPNCIPDSGPDSDPDKCVAWVIDSRDLGSGRWYGHHEVVELPNGNMLLPGFIEKTSAEASAAGFPVADANLCPNAPDLNVLRVDNLWEVAPIDKQAGFRGGWKVVWRWDLWDHFINGNISAKVPHKADIAYLDPAQGICGQYIQGFWTFGRFNAVGFNPHRSEIVMSESLQNEAWIISYNTTTESAKGPAGDLIYRWGNPYAYGAGKPFVNPSNRGDQQLSFQHRVYWIPTGYPGAGNILIFNNGADWGDSSVIELRPPIDRTGKYVQPSPGQAFGPAAPVWEYKEAPGAFFAPNISSAQRLRNGNTLINNGPAGYFFEITPRGEKVWEYKHPANGASQGGTAAAVYRAWRYSPDFAGLASLDITPADPLEKYGYTPSVDIRPGSCKNPVNRKSNGVLPVAIMGSKDLNVGTIDASTILLEGFPAAKWSIEDVGAPGKCEEGGDGIPDLVLKWDSTLIDTALGSLLKRNQFPMRMTGHSSTQGWFLGKDEVFVTK